MTREEEYKLSQAIATVRKALRTHANSHKMMASMLGKFPDSPSESPRMEYWEEVERTQEKWVQLSEDLEKFYSDVLHASPRNTQP